MQQHSKVSHKDQAFLCCVSSDSEFVLYSDETRQTLLEWNRHDDEADRFCMHDGNLAEQSLQTKLFSTTCLHPLPRFYFLVRFFIGLEFLLRNNHKKLYFI